MRRPPKGILLSAAIFAVLAACAKPPPPALPGPQRGLISRELTAAEKALLARSLSQNLKDPDSAKFEWAPVEYLPGAQVAVYCAHVNAKNSYGGYTGNQLFHATLKLDAKGLYTSGAIDRVMSETHDTEELKKNLQADEDCLRNGY